jgi:hypothetical protein
MEAMEMDKEKEITETKIVLEGMEFGMVFKAACDYVNIHVSTMNTANKDAVAIIFDDVVSFYAKRLTENKKKYMMTVSKAFDNPKQDNTSKVQGGEKTGTPLILEPVTPNKGIKF